MKPEVLDGTSVLSHFLLLGGTSSILRTFRGGTSRKKHPVVSQCTRENNLYFYPLRQFYNTHTVFVNNKYVKTVTVTGCINFSFKKAIYLCEFFSNQTRKTILYHPRSASSEAVWASFAKSFSPFFLLILTWQDPDHY